MTQKEREKIITRTTLYGSVVNAVLTIFKFLAGIFGHSGAMIADAIHSLSDFVTDIVVIVFVKISSKPQDGDHEYGHGKYETLAEFFVGLALIVVAAEIIASSIKSIHGILVLGETASTPEMVAIIAAAVSIVSKEILYQYTVRVARKVDSPVMVANAWHHRSDSLSSIVALAGIAVAYFVGGKWAVLDPIAAFLVAVLIIKIAIEIVAPSLGVFLEKSLPKETEKEISDIILSEPQVRNFHNLRTRRLGNCCAIEFHIRVDGELTVSDSHFVTKSLENTLRAKYGAATHIAIHVEPYKEK